LIKQGAKLVQDWNDVVVDLPVEVRRRLIDEGKRRLGVESPAPDQASLFIGPSGPAARAVLGKLRVDSATHIDQLIETMEDTSRSEIVAALFELEMMGLARQLPGNNFVKVW
jgi:DNA processing protein